MNYNAEDSRRYLRTDTGLAGACDRRFGGAISTLRPASFDNTLRISDPNQPDFFMEHRILMLTARVTAAYELNQERGHHRAATTPHCWKSRA